MGRPAAQQPSYLVHELPAETAPRSSGTILKQCEHAPRLHDRGNSFFEGVVAKTRRTPPTPSSSAIRQRGGSPSG